MKMILKCLNKILKTIDLFPTSIFLRYKGQTDYTTATGGFLSITVIIVFIILFASMGIKTLKKEIISTSSETLYEVDPPELQIKMSPDGGFMFGINLFGFDLTSPLKMFDIKLYQESYSPIFNLINRTDVPLVPCSLSHFSFNDKIMKSFFDLNMSKGLCPLLDYNFKVKGKVTSDIFSQIRVTVSRCNSTLDPYCMNDTQFGAIETFVKQFTLVVPLITTYINPENQQYKDYFLEDQNYFSFSSSIIASGLLTIQENTIDTDVSIMPYTQYVTENVIIIPDNIKVSISAPLAGGGQLADVRLIKSTQTKTYNRSFNKVDTYFSYVGGLIGTIIGLIFIMSKYNETAYELSIASNAFKYNDQEEVPWKKFNFGYYLLIPIKKLLNFLNCSVDWVRTQQYIQICEQINSQLDIALLIRKMTFYDAVIGSLLEQDELDAICMRAKPSMNRIKQVRRMHFFQEIYQKERNGEELRKESHQQPLSQEHKDKEGQSGKVNNKHQRQSSQDLSQIDLSHHSQDIRRIENSMKKLFDPSIVTPKLNRHIAKDMKEETLQQIMVHPKESNRNTLEFEELEGGEEHKRVVSTRRRDKEKVEVQDFQYDLSKQEKR